MTFGITKEYIHFKLWHTHVILQKTKEYLNAICLNPVHIYNFIFLLKNERLNKFVTKFAYILYIAIKIIFRNKVYSMKYDENLTVLFYKNYLYSNILLNLKIVK